MRISALITLRNKADLIKAVANAPVGAQFDLVEDPRTTQQNRLMWGLLADVSPTSSCIAVASTNLMPGRPRS